MKMKRGSFKVTMFDNEKREDYFKERNGLYSKFFGIHRLEKDGGYKVTHLPTGYAVTTMRTQKQARRLVERLEQEEFPVSWVHDKPDAFAPNGERVHKVIHEVREEE